MAAVVVVRQRVVIKVEAKCKAKAEVEWQAEGTEPEQGGESLLKQKGQAEGAQVACNCYTTWEFECQVS